MSQAAQLAGRIVVIERQPGFMRLELPGELCGIDVAPALEAGVCALAGVTTVAVDPGWKRISIRYDAAALTTAQVARQLFDVIDALPDEAVASPEVPAKAPPAQATNSGIQPLLDKVKATVIPPGEAPAGSLRARFQPMLESALTEKAVTNFFNDIVAFYLIKVHWDLITKRWLQNPLANSNAWLTTFYLVFLLVRYRKRP